MQRGIQKLTSKEISKLTEEQKKMKVNCPYCGVRIHFYAFEKTDKQLCVNCKHYVFKDSKAEFYYRIKEKLRMKEMY